MLWWYRLKSCKTESTEPKPTAQFIIREVCRSKAGQGVGIPLLINWHRALSTVVFHELKPIISFKLLRILKMLGFKVL